MASRRCSSPYSSTGLKSLILVLRNTAKTICCFETFNSIIIYGRNHAS